MAEIRYREALRDAHAEEMRRDPNVFLMGEEVGVWGGSFKVSEGLLEEFGPERVIDTPISEEVIAGAGTGAAMVGLRPIVELMTINFSLLAMDQIVNHAAKLYYMSGGQHRFSRARRRRPAARRPALAEPRGALCAYARNQGRDAFDTRRCQGAAQVQHPRR